MVAALVVDAALVLVFAAVGRRSHGEADALAGLAHTAWPFLAGLAAGWLLVRALGGRRGWRPLAVVPAGLVVWAGTLVGGHLLRLASGQGSAGSFVVVSAVVLAVFLLGWRLLAGPLARLLGSGRASGHGPRGQD
ncbi:DUF3054 domain-containing protein [Streptomyces sp. NP160]|nr:DUF3054 domain-containing protein [Streptomyces sp. NP160]